MGLDFFWDAMWNSETEGTHDHVVSSCLGWERAIVRTIIQEYEVRDKVKPVMWIYVADIGWSNVILQGVLMNIIYRYGFGFHKKNILKEIFCYSIKS